MSALQDHQHLSFKLLLYSITKHFLFFLVLLISICIFAFFSMKTVFMALCYEASMKLLLSFSHSSIWSFMQSTKLITATLDFCSTGDQTRQKCRKVSARKSTCTSTRTAHRKVNTTLCLVQMCSLTMKYETFKVNNNSYYTGPAQQLFEWRLKQECLSMSQLGGPKVCSLENVWQEMHLV